MKRRGFLGVLLGAIATPVIAKEVIQYPPGCSSVTGTLDLDSTRAISGMIDDSMFEDVAELKPTDQITYPSDLFEKLFSEAR